MEAIKLDTVDNIRDISYNNIKEKTLIQGGDTDTNCAIVGSMAEAMYGIDNKLIEKVNEKIPEKFVKILNRSMR